MNRRITAGLICLAYPFVSYSAPAENQVALNTEDVVVTASRIPQSRGSVLSDVTVIDSEEIEHAGQSTLVELLQRQPGIEISSNGGAGKATSVFLRGTNADHVVVLVDGLRINSVTLGTNSFENIPLAQIERIEILRGPASSLYGADAIGGVIQIFTKRGEGAMKFNAFAGYGSYNTKRAEAGVSGSVASTRYALNASVLDTSGFSSKKVTTGFDADNDPYRDLSVTMNLTQQIAEGHELDLQFFQSRGHNYYDCNSSVCYLDETLRSYAVTSRNQLSSFWNSTLRFGVGVDDSQDHSASPGTFNTDQRQASWQNDFTLPLGTLTLAYDRLEQEVSSTTSYTVKSRDNNGWLASYLADLDAHSLQLSIRRDDNSQYGQHTTGGAAYGYRIAPHWRATASLGTAFKAPTFNQLYFPGFGNANLQPESSRNREISLRYEIQMVHGNLTVFDNQIKNLIVFAPNPINLSEAEIKGVTFDGGWQISEHWQAGGNITVQSPRDQASHLLLPRRGQRHGTLNLSYEAGAFRTGAEVMGTSERFNDSTNTKRMGGYTLLNLTASYAYAPAWRIEARANNILDKEYILAYTGNTATSAPYETAGANLFVGLRWQPE
jgi:vitamin B12 transporter